MTSLTTTCRRALVPLAVLGLALGACSNTSDKGTTTGTTSGGPVTTFSGTDFTKNVPVDAPGVTSTEIHVGSITSKTNPIGGDNVLLNDGIEAYFDVINSKGGIWGRKLKVTSKRDDLTVANLPQTEALLSQDHVYAVFEAV